MVWQETAEMVEKLKFALCGWANELQVWTVTCAYRVIDKYTATRKDDANDLVLTMDKCTEGNCGGLKKGDHLVTLVREGKDTFLRFAKLTSVIEGKRQPSLELEP